MLVRDIMSPASFLQTGDSIKKAVFLFNKTRMDAVPVVDPEGKLLGIFTKSHLYEAILENIHLDKPVKEFMNKTVVTRPADARFEEIAEELSFSQVGQSVVVDQEDKVVGMLTKVDVIQGLQVFSELLANELQSMVKAMYNAAIVINRKGIITVFNPAAEKLLDLAAEDTVGKKIWEVAPELGLEGIVKTGGSEIGRKMQVRDFTVLTNCTPIRRGNNIIGAIAILQDLTQLERVAGELESVKKLNQTVNTILDIAYDGIVVVNETGRVTMINRSLQEHLGISAEEVLGKPIKSVLGDNRLGEVAVSGEGDKNEIQEINGQRYLVSRLPIIEEGKPVGAVGKINLDSLMEIKNLAGRIDSMESKLNYYRSELQRVTGAKYAMDHLLTRDSSFLEVKKQAQKAARGSSTILLLGESGTGKELLAHAIHNASSRRKAPFIKINCAAIPENLLESEFFGYDSGAFTGARKGGKPGKFELADRGTVFLDEIGDMSQALQAKLLRILQDNELERVGGIHTIKVDVRVIAATNKDLKALIEQSKFRDDLYYRLNVISLGLPPLRARSSDIKMLAEFFIEKYNKLLGQRVMSLSPEVLELFQRYYWPGNIRELENVIERAVNLMDGEQVIQLENLPEYLSDYQGRKIQTAKGREISLQQNMLADMEGEVILSALKQAEGNKTRAAKLLGISRTGLYEKMKKYGLG